MANTADVPDPTVAHPPSRRDRPRHRIQHIASLGSSFAAGPGIAPQTEAQAGRSGNNYASLLTAHLNEKGAGAAAARQPGPPATTSTNLTDLSVSGATLLNLLSDGQPPFPPQLSELPASADLVLVLGGGNDMDYVGGLMRDHWAGLLQQQQQQQQQQQPASSSPPSPFATDAVPAATTAPLETAAELAARYGLVLDGIRHTVGPTTPILVVEYLTLLGTDFAAGRDAPFDETRAAHHRAVARRLRDGTEQAARGRPGVHLVPVARLSAGHAIGSARPWVNDFEGLRLLLAAPGEGPEAAAAAAAAAAGVPYHPNAEGMRAVERMVFYKLLELGLVDDDPVGEL